MLSVELGGCRVKYEVVTHHVAGGFVESTTGSINLQRGCYLLYQSAAGLGSQNAEALGYVVAARAQERTCSVCQEPIMSEPLAWPEGASSLMR